MPANTDWNKYNWCSTCRIEQLKEKGFFCGECGKAIRSSARRTNKREMMVIRY